MRHRRAARSVQTGTRRQQKRRNMIAESLEPRLVLEGAVSFNEVMYHPTGGVESNLEWIELYNQQGVEMDLSGWRLSGDVDYTFPANTYMPAGSYLVVAASPSTLQSTTGYSLAKGPWIGSLPNNDGHIVLRDNIDRINCEIHYDVENEWPTGPDGGGVSLAKKSVDLAADVGTNWQSSNEINGTPGAANFPPFTATPVTSLAVGATGPWKYNATNVAPAANWNTLGYSDAAWSSGNGLFGVGDGSAPVAVGNSSFESGVLNPPPGIGPIDNWTGAGNTGATDASGTLNNGNVIPDGARVGVIQYVGSLSQTLSNLDPGKNYTVKYYENERGLVATNKASSSVTLGGTTVVGAHDLSKSTRAKHVVSQPFTAAGTTATLTFANAAPNAAPYGDNALLLDNVQVTRAVPVIGNGNIEAYVPANTFQIAPNGQPGVAWTFTNTAGITRNGSPFQSASGPNPAILAPEGNQMVFISNIGNITQTVSGFEAGTRYSLSWQEGRRMNLGVANDLEIVLDAGLPTQIIVSAAHLVTSSTLTPATSGTFAATKTSYTLTLRSTNPAAAASATTFVDDLNFNFVSDAPVVTTTLPLGASTYYFRAPFTLNELPLATQLKLNYLVDDGAVFYLNGQEIYRTPNMPVGQTHTTPASSGVGNPVFSGQITVPSTALVNGPNVLAVEVHQASPDGGDVFFGADLTKTVTPLAPSTDLVLNEISGGADAATFVEITNIGSASVSTDSFQIVNSQGGSYSIPSQMVAPGAKLSFSEATLGFHAATGANIFLTKAYGNHVPDAIVVKSAARGRLPDGAGPWYYETTTTPGAANIVSVHDEIVINEIMYHHKAQPARDLQQVTYKPIPASSANWKYNQSNVDLGTSWRNLGYNEAGWGTGQGVFYAGPIQGVVGAPVTQAIAGLFNTGVNNSGVVLAAGQADPHYTIVVNAGGAAPIAATVQNGHPAWTANDAQSSWIGITANGTDNVADGNYNYRTSFDLTGMAFNTASLTISVLVDNSLTDILINGQSTGISTAGFAGAFLGPFTINSGFVPGVNTLEFVTNNAGPGANPGGFRAKVSGTVQTIPLNTQLTLGASTYYFRDTFNITGNPVNTALKLTAFVDDGAVFYINGTQVYAQNMPAVFNHSTAASSNVGQPTFTGPITLNIPANLLVTGSNVLAVEVHQSSEGPIDIAFDASLSATETLSPASDAVANPEEWIELYNRSNHTVDLTGWKLDNAADYSFAPGTTIGAGQYLVVARNAVNLQALYPTATIVGNLHNNLPNGGGTIELKDALGNLADAVPYADHGRWPELPDGGGVSLELKDPDSDNSIPESWSYSDESSRTSWQTYTYRGVASSSTGNDAAYNEFIMGLLDSGEVLLDDIHVYADPDGAHIDVLQNGSFEALGLQKWRILGNQSHSELIVDPTNPANHVLRLVATGPTEHLLNHAETTLKNGANFYTITNGTTYEITYRAKWIAGSNLLNTRLYFNRVAETMEIAVPTKSGTPGSPNTRLVANAGPTYSNFQHGPVIPAANQAVTVSAVASDPDGVAAMAIFYSVNGAAFQTVAMTAQGGGSYSGSIPGQPASAIVQFYVQGTDSLGATSTYPGLGTASRAIYKVSDGVALAAGMHNFRVLMTAADTTKLYTPTNVMSDDPMRATVLYDDSTVYYDVEVSLQGSERGRNDASRVGMHIAFSPDNLFRGTISTVSIDHSGGYSGLAGKTGEILVKQLRNRAGFGLPTQYDDQVNLIVPNSAASGLGLLLTERYGSEMLDNTYDNGSDGTVYKMELIYYPTTTSDGTPEGLKLPQPDDVYDIDIRDLGNSEENYRQNFLIQSNRDEDDYTAMIALGKAFSLSGAALDAATKPIMDIDEWARVFAASSLAGVGDTYGQGYGHNLQIYERPEDNKMLAMPWDWDFAYVGANNASLIPGANVGKVFNLPGNQRIFYWNLRDLISTAFNTTYINHATAALSATVGQNWGGAANYLINRSNYVTSQLPAIVPFIITTNSGNDFSVNTSTVTLSGNAWFDVRNIYVQGRAAPLDVTWNTNSTWTATIPLVPGANALTLIGRDPRGNQVASDTITVTTTAGIQLQNTLRVTEIQYHAVDPLPAELAIDPTFTQDDFEYVEIQNIGAQTIDLTGVQIIGDVTFTFPTSAATTLSPGQYVLVVESLTGIAARYNTAGVKIAGEYAQDLSNSGGTLELRDNLGQTIQLFTYDDNGPGWYPTTDGSGPSLVIRDPLAPVATWNDPASWRPSNAPYGSPGIADPSTSIAGRRFFYNHSAFDNQDAAANAGDDGAIATNKSPLLPGGTATAANYTNYSRGINGVMLDVAGLASATLGASDFTFRIGNNNTPASWNLAPAPASITVRPGAGTGGSSRVEIVWPDGAVKNTWLQVTILANANTGLNAADVSYYGNSIGESSGDAVVNSTDEIATRNNNRAFNNLASIDFAYDYNRDRLVNATDQILARSNSTTLATALKLITVPGSLETSVTSEPLAAHTDGTIAQGLAAPRSTAVLGASVLFVGPALAPTTPATITSSPSNETAAASSRAAFDVADAPDDDACDEDDLYELIATDLVAGRS